MGITKYFVELGPNFPSYSSSYWSFLPKKKKKRRKEVCSNEHNEHVQNVKLRDWSNHDSSSHSTLELKAFLGEFSGY